VHGRRSASQQPLLSSRSLHQYNVSERWKRAEAARDMLDNLLSDPNALRALHMVDLEEGEIFESGGESFSVSTDDIRTGLSEWDQQNAKCRLIRRSFQGLGFYLARLNLFMDRGVCGRRYNIAVFYDSRATVSRT